MQGHPYLRFVWPVSVIGVILVAALWPHNGKRQALHTFRIPF